LPTCGEIAGYELSTGTAQYNVSPIAIGNISIPIPPLPEQQAIADYLDRETAKIDTLISETEDTITLMQERRSALISAVVTGKLMVPGVAASSIDEKRVTVGE